MMLKLSSRTPICFTSAYPVLKISAAIRANLTSVLKEHMPQNALCGFLITSVNIITSVKTSLFKIKPNDVIIILNAIFSDSNLRQGKASRPICLPGIADDGYLYEYIEYYTPSFGIIFISLKPDNFEECKNAASMVISKLWGQRDIIDGVHESLKKMYELTGQGHLSYLVRHNRYRQFTTYEMSFFSKSADEKKLYNNKHTEAPSFIV
jgi:hypothetical protein